MKPVRLLRRRSRPDPLAAALALAGGLGVLAATAACSGGEQGTDVVRRDSAGVEIVENPGTERILEWDFQRVATLGGEMEGAESFTSVNPAGVDVDSSGNLYVLDADAFRVVVFDSSLAPVRTLGGEGEGPGELAGPLGLDVSPEGEVAVFDPDGSYVGTLPRGSPVPLLFLPDGRLVAEETDELDVDRLVVYRLDRTAG